MSETSRYVKGIRERGRDEARPDGPGRIRPAHLLLGVLDAEVRTVPRVPAPAGVDRAELAARTRATLSGENGR
jgi:hypothetical protein